MVGQLIKFCAAAGWAAGGRVTHHFDTFLMRQRKLVQQRTLRRGCCSTLCQLTYYFHVALGRPLSTMLCKRWKKRVKNGDSGLVVIIMGDDTMFGDDGWTERSAKHGVI